MKDYSKKKKIGDRYFELHYIEYREDGSIKGTGVEDFSLDRLADKMHYWAVKIRTAQKNKGGRTIWDWIGEIWTTNPKDARKIANIQYGAKYGVENIRLEKIL